MVLGLLSLLLVTVSACTKSWSRQPSPPAAGWKRIIWNPNTDCGYRPFPWGAGYLQPDVSYSLDIPEYCNLRRLEGSSAIESQDRSKPCRVFIRYWGDKHFRESNNWAHTSFPQWHGFNWTDARKEVEYRISVIKKYGNDQAPIQPLPEDRKVECAPLVSRNIDDISFWRADLYIPNGCKIPGRSTVDHKVLMLSDNGLDVHMNDPSSTSEEVVASLRKQ
jgi:hypothetical protein